MNIPNNLKYTKDHEWITVEGNIGTIGVTDYAQGELAMLFLLILILHLQKLKKVNQ